MTRLSGVQLLAASLVLWALASWIFGAPHPAKTETAPVTETTTKAPGAEVEEPEAGANELTRAEATAVPSSAPPANQGTAASPDADPGAGSSVPQAASERTATETASAPSPAGAPTIPPPETRTPPAATGAGSVAGSSITPGDFSTGSTWDNAAGSDAPPASAPPHPRFEQPHSRPLPPPSSGYSAADDDAVAGQLNAARRAAWEGRFADALAHYRAAARLRPKHYVVWGEMGNVLWTMRRWSEAAYALEGAATLLVRAGELRAANDLVPSVGRIDPDAAYRIQRLLWATAQSQPG